MSWSPDIYAAYPHNLYTSEKKNSERHKELDIPHVRTFNNMTARLMAK